MNRNMADKYVSRDDNIHNTLASELPVMGVDRPTARADRQCRYRARDITYWKTTSLVRIPAEYRDIHARGLHLPLLQA